MLHFFNKKNKSTSILITIDNDQLFINEKNVEFPINKNSIIEYFGEPSKIIGNAIYWQNLGISTNLLSNGLINHLSLHTDHNPMETKSIAEQKPFFKGKVIIDGVEVNKKCFDHVTMRKYEVKHFTYTGKKSPCLISIAYNEIYDKNVYKPELEKNKYEIEKLNEALIEFSDFGFKLAIIQELMYNKNLLKPKFDLFEFVECFEKRHINVEKEGYKPIPEVTQYFKDLPIPKKYAPEITEIYQDGGNDIYTQLLRFGGGCENFWNINNIEDAKHFLNLKKAVLCYAKDNIIDELNHIGIQAEWL